MAITHPRTGKRVTGTDPDYLPTRILVLQDEMRGLAAAVVSLQHRLSAVDGKPIDEWPGDTYAPGQIRP